jgi:antirestriction protein ArdC
MSQAYEKITESIVAMLEGGTVPWRKPWTAENVGPTSLSTGKAYRGINVMILGITGMIRGYGSPYWGTYRQIDGRGGQVRKGEKATAVTLWRPVERKNADGEDVKSFFMTTYNVFSADQADWDGATKPVPVVGERREHTPIEDAEAMAKAYLANGPTFSHGGDRAFYSPSHDAVRMPEMGQFHTAEGYYSTLFHELTHSTGHASRLNRDGVTEGHRFGDADYSKEELIAEMGAAFLCSLTGISPDETLANSAAYIKNWLSVLRDDPKMIVQAAGKAQKAADLIAQAVASSEEEAAA